MGSQPNGISASRAAAVLGLSEYQTQVSVFQLIMEEREPGWNEKHGFVLPAPPDNAAIRWGTAFESAVTGLAEKAAGQRIAGRERFFSIGFDGKRGKAGGRDKHPLSCHVDGIYKGDFILHEGKTASSFMFREKWGKPGTDRVPEGYYCQAQHQMICTGAEQVIVSVLVFPETPEAWDGMGWEAYQDFKRPGKGKWMLRRIDKRHDMPDEDYDVVDIESRSPEKWAAVLAEMGFFHRYPVPAKPSLHAAMIERY